jgi:hypothetical protein
VIKVNMIETLILSVNSIKIGKILIIKVNITQVQQTLQHCKLIILPYQTHGLELLQLINLNIIVAMNSQLRQHLLLMELVYQSHIWTLIQMNMLLDLSKIFSIMDLLQLFKWLIKVMIDITSNSVLQVQNKKELD